MTDWQIWLSENWVNIVVPLLVFISIVIIGIWLRIFLYRAFGRWPTWTSWKGRKIVADAMRRPLMDWFILLAAFTAVQASVLSPYFKELAGRIIASLFLISLAWVSVIITERLIQVYARDAKMPNRQTAIAVNVVRITIIVIIALVILSIWGAPVNPILLVLAVIIFVLGLALRDAIPNYVFGMQMSTGKQLKAGDFIKLDSGESGQIVVINWQNTQIKSIQGDTVIIPNNKLAKATVINYGRPLKKASDPFHFFTRLHLRELTGHEACNLTELIAVLRDAPDSVVYYHVHHFLEEHLYLSPEPANDFAIWVNSTLGNNILGERLASIDTFSYPNLGSVKQRVIDTIEDYLRNNPDSRNAPPEEEFHFISSISYILPTAYVCHDLREFIEILRKVTIDSIYFHVFEAKLRLQKGTNDFSIWITDSLGEKELGDKIASIDPYTYTLESLRNRIIELVENYIR